MARDDAPFGICLHKSFQSAREIASLLADEKSVPGVSFSLK